MFTFYHPELMLLASSSSTPTSTPNNRVRVALGVLIRLMLPLTHGVARGWKGLRGLSVLALLRKVRESHGLLTTLFAVAANTVSMSLSSVQVAHRIDPLLRVIKLRKDSSPTVAIKQGTTTPTAPTAAASQLASLRVPRHLPERCVDLVVLAEPPPGVPIRADIVLIHGLHGSLVNTWKQGLWNSEGRLVNFERPPKPPLRPPKRQRHSRANLFAPPHVSKRPKFEYPAEWENEGAGDRTTEHDHQYDESRSTSYEFAHRRYTYECGEPDEVHFADDVEYSFPTFRLRIEESEEQAGGRKPATAIDDGTGSPGTANGKRKLPKPTKDANWSPCWPGDWLPLDCPGVRVIAVNYTTDPYLWRPVWITKRNRSSLVDRAREMSDLLIAKGVGRGHPIVWVGHSKGGIFIKQILVDAWESRPAAEPLWQSSRGTFFYSIDVFSFVETAMTLMSVMTCASSASIRRVSDSEGSGQGPKIQMDCINVAFFFTDPGIGEVCGVHLDHREICKPRSRNCILYTELVKMINRVS
ncbi:AGAP011045-PA [Anopheles gambiae str. PEST]|uniref:AGAP011045-PA n=1 Tax=Anopheles gambiae TaxID=7165 RepID=Q7PTI7_ANOGA|nr:AGAP011045-PA [Anopheles gambiae str. PEST]